MLRSRCVVCDEYLHFLVVLKALKDAIIKHNVELVLDRRKDRVLLKDIDNQVLKLSLWGLHLCLIKETLVSKEALFLRYLLHFWKPWVCSLEYRKN